MSGNKGLPDSKPVEWANSAAVLTRLTERAREGVLSPEEMAFLADSLDYYRDAALRLESAIHRLTK
jgi:hypothetical protein